MKTQKKYSLAIKRGNKDYLPIDGTLLPIYNHENLSTLSGIDSFTSRFTEIELIENILSVNIVPPTERFIKFVIIFMEKGNIRELKEGPCFIENSSFLKKHTIYQFFTKNFYNKVLLNKVYNFLNNKNNSKELEEFRYIINNIDFFLLKGEKVAIVAFQKIYELEHEESRKLGMYLAKNVIPSLNKENQGLLKKENK